MRAPLAVMVPFVADHRPALLALYLVGIATDVFDGVVARAMNTTSQTGAYADSLADKVFHIAVALVLVGWGYMPWWWLGLWFTRDLLQGVLIGIFYRDAFDHDDFERDATPLGKATTVLVGTTICVVLLDLPELATALTWSVGGVGLAAAIGYGLREQRIRQRR